MTRERKIWVAHEGKTDKGVLDGLVAWADDNAEHAAAQHAALASLEIRSSKGPEGQDAVLAGVATTLKLASRLLVVLDLDDGTLVQRGNEVRTRLEQPTVEQESLPFATVEVPPARIGVVVVGLPGDALTGRLGISRFTIDDYILRAATQPAVYAGLARRAKDVPPLDKVTRKLDELKTLFDQNALPLRTSKRFAMMLRAVMGYTAAPATFGRDVVECAAALDRSTFEGLFQPLLGDIVAAAQWVAAAPPADVPPA